MSMSKVVFVGNVPYSMGEEQLIDVFKSVGEVVGFRLVFDRETGKPRGYGFCEFLDHETAASAVRNLNNTDVGGRSIRIDLADTDPFLEGKTTVRGELVDSGYPGPSEPRHQWRSSGSTDNRARDFSAILAALPQGVQVPPGASALDYITDTLVGMQPSQLMEVLAQMKAFIITHPDPARQLLVAHPQLAHALFQSLVMNNIVDSSILQRMIAASTQARPQPPPARPPPPPSHTQQHPPPQHYPGTLSGYPPPPVLPPQPHPQSMPGHVPPHMSGQQMYPPPPAARSVPPPGSMPPPPMPSYYPPPQSAPQPVSLGQPHQPSHPPPPQQSAAPSLPTMSEEERAMLIQVFNMTQEQINGFSDQERTTIQTLRSKYSQFAGGHGA